MYTVAAGANYRYYTGDSVEKFKELGKLIPGEEIDPVERVDLDCRV